MFKLMPPCMCVVGLLSIAGHTSSFAQLSVPQNTLKIGYAGIHFRTNSGDLTGPPGTTPPGVQAEIKDAKTLALVYERKISGPWSFALQMGVPPTIRFNGAGAGAALGEVGSAKAWFPSALVTYSLTESYGVRPYVGAGLNYTYFNKGRISPAYNNAFGGLSSTATLKSSIGPVAKLGIEIPIADNWVIDFAYSRYWLKTTATVVTATPGVGNIERKVDVKFTADVFGAVVGYRF